MNAMNMTEYTTRQWYVVKMKPPGQGRRRTTVLGADYEGYRGRDGQAKKRRIPGTGQKAFVPQVILERAGFKVFLPVKRRWEQKSRFSSEKVLNTYPMLADWLFIGWPSGQCRWSDLMDLGVVQMVLGSGGRPLRVHDEMVDMLKVRFGGRAGRVEARRVARAELPQLKVGAQVVIADGPFEDFDGPILDVNGAGARVMVTLFGRKTPLQIDTGSLRPVAENRAAPVVSDPLCPRCSGAMVASHSNQKGFHVRCRDCGAVSALNSASPAGALARWRGEGGAQKSS